MVAVRLDFAQENTCLGLGKHDGSGLINYNTCVTSIINVPV